MLLTGALMSVVTGQYDISAILASLGVPFVGLVALVLATWTTNVTNAYSGGLALSNLLGFDESKFKVTTGVAGAIGTLLAAFGLLNAFQGFLSLMSALIPPLCLLYTSCRFRPNRPACPVPSLRMRKCPVFLSAQIWRSRSVWR